MKKISERDKIILISFIAVVVIIVIGINYWGYLMVASILDVSGEKKDFCLYKNYTSYSEGYCYKQVGDAMIESPQVVDCNSNSGYCFKIERIIE